MSAADMHAGLLKLQKSGFAMISVASLPPILDAAIDITASLSKECIPQLTRLGSSSVAVKVQKRLLFTLQADVGGRTLIGQQALDDMLDKLQAPASSSPGIAYKDTLVLRQYSAYLTTPKQVELKAICDKSLAAGGQVVPVSHPASSSSSAAAAHEPPKKRKRVGKADKDNLDLEALFKN